MLDTSPYAVAHVSPNCDQRTKEALQELVDAVAKQHGLDTPIELILVERDPINHLAALPRDTEAFDE